jgi:hypothetical protein
MRFYFTRSARHHRIGHAHAFAAMTNAGEPIAFTDRHGGTSYNWTANDDRGVELEIFGRLAIEDPNLMIVYHVMPLWLKEHR